MPHLSKEAAIPADQLPEPYRRISEIAGLDAALEMAREFGGQRVYFPQLGRLNQLVRDRQIRQQYNGYNTKELARRHGLSESRIRKIVVARQ